MISYHLIPLAFMTLAGGLAYLAALIVREGAQQNSDGMVAFAWAIAFIAMWAVIFAYWTVRSF